MATIVKPYQSLFDIALRETGSISTIFDIAQRNDLQITDELLSGQALDTSDIAVAGTMVINYYRTHNIHPATSITLQKEATKRGGVGYMGISIDFKIS
jgi:hypothetical protein